MEDAGKQMVIVCREVDQSTGAIAVYLVANEVTDHLLFALPIRARANQRLRYFVVMREQWENDGGRQSLTKLFKKRTLNNSNIAAIGGILEL